MLDHFVALPGVAKVLAHGPTKASVRLADGERHYALLRWGLIPGWVKDPRGFTLLINAGAVAINMARASGTSAW